MQTTIKCPDCGKLIAPRFPMHDCKPKNPHAVSLGKLGGRKPGFTGKPLDPAKARAMVASRWAKYRANKAWNRCDVCGQFIPISDFDNGATRKLITPDSDRSSEQYETLCKIHTRANKQTTVNKGK